MLSFISFIDLCLTSADLSCLYSAAPSFWHNFWLVCLLGTKKWRLNGPFSCAQYTSLSVEPAPKSKYTHTVLCICIYSSYPPHKIQKIFITKIVHLECLNSAGMSVKLKQILFTFTRGSTSKVHYRHVPR